MAARIDDDLEVSALIRDIRATADAFIFLAVMMYALAPANNLGPPIVLAALMGLLGAYVAVRR